MYFVTIGLFLLAVSHGSAEETMPVFTTTPYSTIGPEEAISRFDQFYKTVDNIKFDPQLSNWRQTTNSTSAPSTEKKKAPRKARITESTTKHDKRNTTKSETEEDLERYETANLPEDTAPHLYDPPSPWTPPPRTKGFTGTFTRNPKYPPRQAIGNYTPPFNNEHYDNYQRMFQQQGGLTQPQQQIYPQNYNSPPIPQPPPPPPPLRNWPQQDNWPASQDQQQPNYDWQSPGPEQGPQQGFHYGSRQGPPTGPPPQGPLPPLMQEQPFDQQSELNEQIPADARFDQGQYRSPRRQFRRRFNNQDDGVQRNDSQMNYTRPNLRRRFSPRRWGPRYGHQYQQGGQYWQPQYPMGAPPPHIPMQPPPPPPPPPPQVYPQMPQRNWPQPQPQPNPQSPPQYYPQQPNNYVQRGYQPQSPNQNWQSNVNGNPNWPVDQNQQQYMRDNRFNYPPQDPRMNQQMRPRNNRQSLPPPPPPPPPHPQPQHMPPPPPPPHPQYNIPTLPTPPPHPQYIPTPPSPPHPPQFSP